MARCSHMLKELDRHISNSANAVNCDLSVSRLTALFLLLNSHIRGTV